MRVTYILVLVFYCGISFAQDTVRPTGKNCNLSLPPPSAGEEMNHGVTLKIYPRAVNIDSRFTGCQALWAPIDGKWHTVALVEIISGDPVSIWSPDESDPARLGCRYKNGKVVKGDANNCPAPRFLIAKSMASGCVAKITRLVERDGIGAARPPGCQYE